MQIKFLSHLNRYENIMKFVILKFWEDGDISKYSEVLAKIMKKVQPDYRYCLGVVSASGCNSEVVGMLAQAVKKEDKWIVWDFALLGALLELVRHKPPEEISIGTIKKLEGEDTEKLVHFLTELDLTFSGRFSLGLHHSHANYEPVDERIFAKLSNKR